MTGPHNIGGEWGHNPLPWPKADEHPGPKCWCGRTGVWDLVSGGGLERDHALVTGQNLSGEAIAEAALSGDTVAVASLERHSGRLARGLSHVVNLFDPEAIVLGGGLSNLQICMSICRRRCGLMFFAMIGRSKSNHRYTAMIQGCAVRPGYGMVHQARAFSEHTELFDRFLAFAG